MQQKAEKTPEELERERIERVRIMTEASYNAQFDDDEEMAQPGLRGLTRFTGLLRDAGLGRGKHIPDPD